MPARASAALDEFAERLQAPVPGRADRAHPGFRLGEGRGAQREPMLAAGALAAARPMRASSARCLAAAWREMPARVASSVAVSGPSIESSRTMSRRVGSASAANTRPARSRPASGGGVDARGHQPAARLTRPPTGVHAREDTQPRIAGQAPGPSSQVPDGQAARGPRYLPGHGSRGRRGSRRGHRSGRTRRRRPVAASARAGPTSG